MILRNKTLIGAAALAALLAGLAGCQKRDNTAEGPAERAGERVDQAVQTAGEKMDQAGQNAQTAMDDTTITAAVKTHYVENKEVDAANVSVNTTSGKVTLTGTVKNDSEKAAAERIAHGVKGVTSVDNQLVVRP